MMADAVDTFRHFRTMLRQHDVHLFRAVATAPCVKPRIAISCCNECSGNQEYAWKQLTPPKRRGWCGSRCTPRSVI